MYVSFAYNVRVKWIRMLFKVPRYDQMFPHCPSNIDLFMNKSNIMLIRPVGNPVLIDQFICFHSDIGEIFWVARWGLRSQCSDHNSPTGTCLLHLSRRTLETGLFCPPPLKTRMLDACSGTTCSSWTFSGQRSLVAINLSWPTLIHWKMLISLDPGRTLSPFWRDEATIGCS